MSAIADFIAEVRRQRDLLEYAAHRDSFAEALLDGHGTRAPENRRRIWTRRDKNRIELFRNADQVTPGAQLIDELPSVGSFDGPLYWTRVARIVPRFLPPRGQFVNWHCDDEGRQNIGRFLPAAITEARRVGATDLPEMFLEMVDAHYDLVRYFYESKDDQFAEAFEPWGSIDDNWNSTLEKIERLSPPETAAEEAAGMKDVTIHESPVDLPNFLEWLREELIVCQTANIGWIAAVDQAYRMLADIKAVGFPPRPSGSGDGRFYERIMVDLINWAQSKPTKPTPERATLAEQFEALRDAIHSAVFWLRNALSPTPGGYSYAECSDQIRNDILPVHSLDLPAIDEVIRRTTGTAPHAWTTKTLEQLDAAVRLVGRCRSRDQVPAIADEATALATKLDKRQQFLLSLSKATGIFGAANAPSGSQDSKSKEPPILLDKGGKKAASIPKAETAARNDRVGTLAIVSIGLVENLHHCAETITGRDDLLFSDPAALAGLTSHATKLLGELGVILTEAVPMERARKENNPYSSGYGTQLVFSDPNYQPGGLTSFSVPLRFDQTESERLATEELAQPKAWLHSARGAALNYAAEFWDLCCPHGTLSATAQQGRYGGRALELPSGQKLTPPTEIFADAYTLRSWARGVIELPRLTNASACKMWIASEAEVAAKTPPEPAGPTAALIKFRDDAVDRERALSAAVRQNRTSPPKFDGWSTLITEDEQGQRREHETAFRVTRTMILVDSWKSERSLNGLAADAKACLPAGSPAFEAIDRLLVSFEATLRDCLSAAREVRLPSPEASEAFAAAIEHLDTLLPHVAANAARTAAPVAPAEPPGTNDKFHTDPLWRELDDAIDRIEGQPTERRNEFVRNHRADWDGFLNSDELNRLTVAAGLYTVSEPMVEMDGIRTTLRRPDGASSLSWDVNTLAPGPPAAIVKTLKRLREIRGAQLTRSEIRPSPKDQTPLPEPKWQPQIPPPTAALLELSEPDLGVAKEVWTALNVLEQAITAWSDWLSESHRRFSKEVIALSIGDAIARRGRTAFTVLEKLGVPEFLPDSQGTRLADDWPMMTPSEMVDREHYVDPANYRDRESPLALARFRLCKVTINNVRDLLDELGQHPAVALGKVRFPGTVDDTPANSASVVPAEELVSEAVGAGTKVAARASTNALMIDKLSKVSESQGWSLRKWATEVRRSTGAVAATPTWKEVIAPRRKLEAATKAMDRHRR